MSEWNWGEWITPVLLSVRISLVASILAALLGISAAWLMSRRSWRGKTAIETIMLLPLVLPPTVVGFILLMALGRNSWVGQAFERLFDFTIIFTWGAGVIAAVVVAFPLVYQTMKTGFASIDPRLGDAARSAGASEWEVFRYIALPLARRSVAAAYLLGFARGLGEFGATLMIAGNIPGRTQTVPTAIYVAVDSGHLGLAWTWTIAMAVISFILLLLTSRSVNE
ncbi:molybdate ABC transporter permease subunit [Paenibacillus sp. GCM10023252]|uniref:molybdate ABC transporter permease subunit n=1 Tax=Paenibacillus sp. GCM10023252 TaxID=3252649 RepID=UPI0036146E06